MKLFDLQKKPNDLKTLEILEKIEGNQREIGEALYNLLKQQVELVGVIGEILEKKSGEKEK